MTFRVQPFWDDVKRASAPAQKRGNEFHYFLLGKFAAVKKDSQRIQPATHITIVASVAGRNPNGKSLALPDVLTAPAGDRLGGKFFFHRLPTNRTFFLPHIDTHLFFRQPASKKVY
jgi:hypothetical protein